MLDLRHPDGDALTEYFQRKWLDVQVQRVLGYIALEDREGAVREAKALYEALDNGRIPESAYYNGAHR